MKRMFLTAIALLAASAARAVVLAWTVDLTESGQANTDYKFAVLYAVHDSTEEALDSVQMDNKGEKTLHDHPSTYHITPLGTEESTLSDFADYKFYIKMFGSDNGTPPFPGQPVEPLACSETKTFSELGPSGNIRAIEMNPEIAELRPWIIAFVPEPATAMLFCLGAAALALRRRRG